MKPLKKMTSIAMLAIMLIITGCSGANAGVRVLAEGDNLDLSKNPERLTIIDFNATWCGPCVAFGPIFEAAAEKYGNKVDFISVDVDKHPALAQQLNIRSIPAILFIHPDGTRDWSIGLMSAEEFDQRIQDAQYSAMKSNL